MHLVDLGLTLGVKATEGELADVDAAATEVLLTQELAVELILPLADAGLDGAEQELLGGVLRHLVCAACLLHHHETGYAQDAGQIGHLKATLFEQLELLGSLAEELGIGHVVEHDDIVGYPVLGELLGGLAQLVLVGTAQQAHGVVSGLLLLDEHFVLTALGYVLESLIVGGGGDRECLHGELYDGTAHIHRVGHDDVLEVDDVLCWYRHDSLGTVLTVEGDVVGVGDGIIATSGAEPEVDGITILVTLDVDVGVTPVDLAVDDLLLHLTGGHERVGTYLKEVVDLASDAVAVLDEVASFLVALLPLGDHLAHGLHEQGDTTVPGGDEQRGTAYGTHYIGLPVGTLGLLVLRRVRVSGRGHARSSGLLAAEQPPVCKKVVHKYVVFVSF